MDIRNSNQNRYSVKTTRDSRYHTKFNIKKRKQNRKTNGGKMCFRNSNRNRHSKLRDIVISTLTSTLQKKKKRKRGFRNSNQNRQPFKTKRAALTSR